MKWSRLDKDVLRGNSAAWSNWKTFVAQWRSGEEDDVGKAMEVHGALKGGLVNLPWGKRDGLGLA